MQIITAPSKTQQFNGRSFTQHSLPFLPEKTKILIDRLKLLDRKELSRLMKTSEKLTESTYQLIHDFSLPFSPDNSKQALFTFQGDAYNSIQADNYTKEQLHHAQKHLFILSGLYGILRPLDLIQPYRLEMGCSLIPEGAANLYHFWKTEITDIINEALTKSSARVLINLASTEYSKVVDKKKLQGEMVTITFKQLHKDRYRTIPIHSKRARGMMIHFAISNLVENAESLKDFTLDSYNFSKEESTATEWFFFKRV